MCYNILETGAPGANAFDGVNVITGAELMTETGALRFVVGLKALASGYDANGNMTLRLKDGARYFLAYDAENRLTSVSGTVSASFAYNGDGQRLTASIGTTTTYIGGYFEWKDGVGTSYYFAGAQRIAMRASAGVKYLMGDHLGSTAVTALANGAFDTETRYYPWGGVRWSSGPSPTDYQFTGQQNLDSIGLYFYRTRFYDAALGQFSQADNISPRIESKTQDAEQIRVALTVSYFHPTNLSQLSKYYQDAWFESSSKSEYDNPLQSNKFLPSLTSHTETNHLDSNAQTMRDAQNLGDLGRVEYESEAGVYENIGNRSEQVTPAALGMYFTAPERYSYTKNCPTRYTDPMGQTECDVSQAIAGLGIVGLGVVPFGLGLGLAISGIAELSATSITIVGIFVGFHSLAVGTLMMGSGYAIMRAGVMAIMDSGCIPGLSTDSTSP